MADKLEVTKQMHSEANTSTQEEGKTLSQKLKEKGYRTSEIGKAFIMPFKMPRGVQKSRSVDGKDIGNKHEQ